MRGDDAIKLTGIWQACWPVLDDKSLPGISCAVPLYCTMHHKCGPLDSVHTLNNDKSRILWMGWNPDIGIVHTWTDWNSKEGNPGIPTTHWFPYSSKESLVPQKDFSLCFADLPFPSWAQGLQARTRELARQLSLQNKKYFLQSLPEGTLDCIGIISTTTLKPSNLWNFTKYPLGNVLPMDTMNFLLGDNHHSGVGARQAGLRRRQFVQSYPVFSGLAANYNAQIDSGVGVVDYIADHLGCTRGVVKALSLVDETKCKCVHEFLNKPWGLALIQGMPPSWLCSLRNMSVPAWESVDSLLENTGHNPTKGHVFGGMTAKSMKPLSKSLQSWTRIVNHLGSTLLPDKDGLEWLVDCASAWPHLEDTVRDMTHELLWPAQERCWPQRETRVNEHHLKAALLCLGVRKLSRVLQAHLVENIHGARLGLALGKDSAGWGQAAAPVVSPSGLTMRFLSNQAELDAEANGMNHCVGSYGQQCAEHTSAIMSLGHWSKDLVPTWNPSSTIELRMVAKSSRLQIQIAQHYGVSNKSPLEQDKKAAEWWLGQVNSGVIILNDGSLIARHGDMQSIHGRELAIQAILGEAWRTPQAHAHRWDRWKRLLDTRANSFGDWLLALPSVYLDSSPSHALLTEIAVDMDQEMGITALVDDIADNTLQQPDTTGMAH